MMHPSHLSVIPGRSEAKGKGIHTHSALWIPFPRLRLAGDVTLLGKGGMR